MIGQRTTLGALIALIALGGCASHHVDLASVPPLAVPQPLAPMPQPPSGSRAGMAIPTILADGSYATPNRMLDVGTTLWHLRVALNVAALACRGPEGQAIIVGYNAMLARDETALARANAAAIKANGGQAGYDEAMTRLYNFFAQPGATADFCAAAAKVIGEISGAAGPVAIAAPALTELDEPFQAFYRRYDAYRARLARWQADRLHRALQPVDGTPQMALAAAAPVPVTERTAAGSVPHLGVDPSIFRPY